MHRFLTVAFAAFLSGSSSNLAWAFVSPFVGVVVSPGRRDSGRSRATSVSDDENSSTDSAIASNDNKSSSSGNTDALERRKRSSSTTVKSKALPFLDCPDVLKDCEFAGNVGFDPLGLADTKEKLWQYREAEIKHARLAMLAAAGWPLSELLDRKIAAYFGVPSILDQSDRVPTALSGGLEKISPTWWGFCLGLCAAVDMYGVARARSGDPEYFPGYLGFDPAGLYPVDTAGRKRMQLAEIKHGRLAMLAVLGYTVEEYITKVGVVDETPFFFTPLTTEAVESISS